MAKNSKIKKIMCLVSVFVVAFVCIFSTACSNTLKGFRFKQYQNEDGSGSYYSVVDFRIHNPETAPENTYYVREVWVKIAAIDPDKKCTQITFNMASSLSETGTWSNVSGLSGDKTIANNKSVVGTWVRIFDSVTVTSSSRAYYSIGTKNNVTIAEIVLVDADFNVVDIDRPIFVGAAMAMTGDGSKQRIEMEKYNKANVLFDEQDSFDRDKELAKTNK